MCGPYLADIRPPSGSRLRAPGGKRRRSESGDQHLHVPLAPGPQLLLQASAPLLDRDQRAPPRGKLPPPPGRAPPRRQPGAPADRDDAPRPSLVELLGELVEDFVGRRIVRLTPVPKPCRDR